MRMRELLKPESVFFGVPGVNKKRLLEDIATELSKTDERFNVDEVFEALLARERLGSTGIGEGIAFPHCRSNKCEKPIGLLFTLNEPVDYEASDNQPVDIVLLVIVPDTDPEEHLNTLSALANLFGQSEYRKTLRNANSADELYENAVNSPIELELAS